MRELGLDFCSECVALSRVIKSWSSPDTRRGECGSRHEAKESHLPRSTRGDLNPRLRKEALSAQEAREQVRPQTRRGG